MMSKRIVPVPSSLLTRLTVIGGVLLVVAAACSNDNNKSRPRFIAK